MIDSLLQPLVTIFALSILVILVSDRLKLPTLVGFLLTGILCGPHGLRLIASQDDVKHMAEIGVVLLLFKIGMKLPIQKIMELKRFFFLGGFFQVFITALIGFGVGQVLGRPFGESIFLGFLLSLSSTAIVLKLLEDRLETTSPQGKVCLGILIFQDVAAVLMMIVIPFLSPNEQGGFSTDVIFLLLKGFLVLLFVFLLAERVVPKGLYLIAKTRKRELFFISVLTICFGVALVASNMGLSLSFGAFLAGLIIAESEYSSEAIGGIIPSQEVFTSLFFVSVGMLFDISFVIDHPILVFFVALGVLLMKGFVVMAVTLFLGQPLRTAIISGMALSQVGEFSFVLVSYGIAAGIGTPFHYHLFLAVSVLTMALTPFLIHSAPYVAKYLLKLPFPTSLKNGFHPLVSKQEVQELSDHLIIVGFGINGRHLARAAKLAKIPYVILEMNPETVERERKNGEPIHFGDASHETVLNHVNIERATVLAVLVNDPVGLQHIVSHARRLNPGVYIIARTRYITQMPIVYKMGANEVIPDEFGSAVEVFSRVLQKYDVPEDLIEKNINELREEGYRVLRHLFSFSSS